MLRIATWNVNSLRVRLETLAPWLAQDGPDIVCLQETKVTDDLFPIPALADLGYQAAFTGQKTYNGVALLSRLPMTDVVTALPGAPPEEGSLYRWWEYRPLAFQKNLGFRIAHILAPPPLAARCTAVTLERELRKLPKPSDHIPVVATFS